MKRRSPVVPASCSTRRWRWRRIIPRRSGTAASRRCARAICASAGIDCNCSWRRIRPKKSAVCWPGRSRTWMSSWQPPAQGGHRRRRRPRLRRRRRRGRVQYKSPSPCHRNCASRLVAALPLFILARNPGAGGPPLAVQRHSSDSLPLNVTLSERDAMIPSLSIATVPKVVVVARLSRSGAPQQQSGDLLWRGRI